MVIHKKAGTGIGRVGKGCLLIKRHLDWRVRQERPGKLFLT